MLLKCARVAYSEQRQEKMKMNPILRWFSLTVVCALTVFATIYAPDRANAAPNSTYCTASEYRQFDFWAGDWDVFDVGGSTKVAHARVDLILDGCVLREDYQGADGHKGQSFSLYDSTRKVWHQSWVTNHGELLTIEGKFAAGAMVMTGEDRTKNALVRGEWKPENGNVRETAVTSTDSGKTWKPWFDLVFRRSAGAAK